MKFIFPKNYKYRAKILGFIDYITAIVDAILGFLLFFIIKLFTKKISTQIYIFIILFVPDGENIISYIIQIVRFIRRRGVYFYDKSIEKNKPQKWGLFVVSLAGLEPTSFA